MIKPSEELVALLKKNFYHLKTNDSSFEIRSRFNYILFSYISIGTGLILLVFGAFVDSKIFLLGLVLILSPIVYGKYKYPSRIVFDQSQKTLLLFFNSWIPVTMQFSNIDGLLEDRIIHNTSASPFRKGTQKYVYRYFIHDKQGAQRKLIRFESFNELDQLLKEFELIFSRMITS